MNVTVLTGGVGGARFLRGIVDAVDPASVTAIVNVGDDLDVLGLSVSPLGASSVWALLEEDREGASTGPLRDLRAMSFAMHRPFRVIGEALIDSC